MGRDVTGLRIDKKPNVSNVNSISTNQGAVHVTSKALAKKVVTKDYDPGDHTVKDRVSDEFNNRQDMLGIKSTNHETEQKIIRAEAQKSTDKKLSSPVKPASVSAVNGTNDANSVEPLTPAGEAKKQTSCTGHADGAETNDSGVRCSPQSNDLHTPKTTKKSQPNSPTEQHHFPNRKNYDEEDNWSLASSTATSVRTVKSRVTVPVAPKFSCEERLERRKEFYSKLEEKHKALEKERLEYEARTREEEQAAIKQLRKSMVYKANPVPSFYRVGPPPKVELKKLPITRAKSPKLTRRKSCGDATSSCLEDKGLHGGSARHSIGIYREGKNSPVTPQGKNGIGARKLNGKNKVKDEVKDHPQELKETTENSHMKGQEDVDNVVES